ncbi:hypothetical protein CO614_03485 [Lysobacteraceae bacterium NML120232]|nr:hypothetical protein CO614_03485 [Xanthomonadaceae bacterium NML120232]
MALKNRAGHNYRGNYTYLYTDQDSYEPLAHIFYNNKDAKLYLTYYHTDQIGIPREQTDQFGNLLWFGEYTAWGCLKDEKRIYQNAHQPFRLQNQYYDQETGLHYNLMRYYEPDTGRFVNQDPIGLVGGDNFYQFAPNAQEWIDPWGWKRGKSQSFDSWVKGKKSDTHVYIGCRDGKAVYVGIAKDIPKRQKQHDGKNRNFKLIALTDSAMNRGFARSIEQSIINSNPKFENSINSISPKRALYKDAVAWGDDWMKENIKGGVSSLCPEAKKKGKSKCKK